MSRALLLWRWIDRPRWRTRQMIMARDEGKPIRKGRGRGAANGLANGAREGARSHES